MIPALLWIAVVAAWLVWCGVTALQERLAVVTAGERLARGQAQHWFDVARGAKPEPVKLTQAQAERIMRGVFSNVALAEDERLAREARRHRALFSRDHTKRHHAEGVVASEWATEVMQFCVGPLEVEGE